MIKPQTPWIGRLGTNPYLAKYIYTLHSFSGFMVVRRSELSGVVGSVRASFAKVKDELDDHLEAINGNSAEIQSLYGFLSALEQRLDKLSDRLDEIFMPVSSLSIREQELFLALYTASSPLSVRTLASRLGFSTAVVYSLLDFLRQRDVPVVEVKVGRGIAYALDKDFCELQAKEQVVKIDSVVAKNFHDASKIDA